MDVPGPPPAFLEELQAAAKAITIKVKMRFIPLLGLIPATEGWDWLSFRPQSADEINASWAMTINRSLQCHLTVCRDRHGAPRIRVTTHMVGAGPALLFAGTIITEDAPSSAVFGRWAVMLPKAKNLRVKSQAIGTRNPRPSKTAKTGAASISIARHRKAGPARARMGHPHSERCNQEGKKGKVGRPPTLHIATS
jgi:hypothetical protein